jgi:hypothetical protein
MRDEFLRRHCVTVESCEIPTIVRLFSCRYGTEHFSWGLKSGESMCGNRIPLIVVCIYNRVGSRV